MQGKPILPIYRDHSMSIFSKRQIYFRVYSLYTWYNYPHALSGNSEFQIFEATFGFVSQYTFKILCISETRRGVLLLNLNPIP
jgi:hypothetical protein